MAGGAVIDLPGALAPWAPQLAILPTDVALSLAPWIGRLALAIGPLATTERHQSGEPDGYSGLARRGSYERLVTGEWGVAELFPDEFVRRAASGEHLFLELARREPHGALRSIALVSAGPAQLGAPRLAHIASLIVLARRAAAAGASFCWGVLEDREHRLIDGLDESGIDHLLEARTARAADDDAFAGWLDALGDGETHDFWFIGGDEDAPAANRSGASRIVVRDLLVPGTRALEVEIARRGPPVRVRLDLPAPDDCVRVLRDPFQRRAASNVAAARARASEVRFAPDGRRLIVRLEDSVFETWPVPSSPHDKLGKFRRWEPPQDEPIVALGIGRQTMMAATATREDPTRLTLRYSNNHPIVVKVPDELASALAERLADSQPIAAGSCALLRMREHARADLILDVLGRLLVVPHFALWPRPGTVLTALPFNKTSVGTAPLALATAFYPSHLLWAERGGHGELHVMQATASGNQRVAKVGTRAGAFMQDGFDVQFGFAMPPRSSWGVVSIAWDAQHRQVVAADLAPTRIEAVVPVVGVCLRDRVPWLLTRPHPYRLAWLAGDGRATRRQLLPTASAPITSVAVSSSQPTIAWLTETGEVVVYSMKYDAVLFRRTPEGSR